MTEYGKRAGELFAKGYNCAQAVSCAFAERFNLPVDTLAALACPFGGGVAGMRNTCGAVSGMLVAIGLAKGNIVPGSKEKKLETYALAKEAIEEFEKACKSIVCSELLAMQGDAPVKGRSCREICEIAADIAAKHV